MSNAIEITATEIKVGDLVSFWGRDPREALAVATTTAEYNALGCEGGLPEGWVYVSTYIDSEGKSRNGMVFPHGTAYRHVPPTVTLEKSVASQARAEIRMYVREHHTFGIVREALLTSQPTMSPEIAQLLAWRLSENDPNFLTLAFGALTR